jgi:hypothetical protein
MTRLYHLLTWGCGQLKKYDADKSAYLFQKFVTIWPLVNIVQNRHLGAYYLAAGTQRRLELHFNHAARLKAAALGHAVY